MCNCVDLVNHFVKLENNRSLLLKYKNRPALTHITKIRDVHWICGLKGYFRIFRVKISKNFMFTHLF